MLREQKYFLRRFLKNIKLEGHDRTPEFSYKAYQSRGDRSLDLFYNPVKRQCMVDGRLKRVPSDYTRRHHLSIIQERIADAKTVLEVGCGNAVNLVELRRRLPNKSFAGIEYAPNRIEIAHEYYGDELDDIDLKTGSVAALPYEDDSFDIVFTMHCLEQCEQIMESAVSEILRVARRRAVLIEPDYQNANYAQRAYLRRNDFARTLLPELEKHGSEWSVEHVRLDIYVNPQNRSGLFAATRK